MGTVKELGMPHKRQERKQQEGRTLHSPQKPPFLKLGSSSTL